MTFFNPSEDVELARLSESLMTGEATFRKPDAESMVETTPGTYVQTDKIVATDVPIAYRPVAAPTEVVLSDAVTSVTDYLLRIPRDVEFQVTADMEVDVDGLTFTVIGPYEKSTMFSRWIRATLKRPGGL